MHHTSYTSTQSSQKPVRLFLYLNSLLFTHLLIYSFEINLQIYKNPKKLLSADKFYKERPHGKSHRSGTQFLILRSCSKEMT